MNRIEEVWKGVPGFPNYEVSNFGRVRSLTHYDSNGVLRKGRILAPTIGSDEYPHVVLYDKGKRKEVLVHRLVAQLFVPNPENKEEVNHKDECKINNVWLNLEWMSRRENANYGTRNERARETMIKKGMCREVLMLNLEGEVLREFRTMSEAVRHVNGRMLNIYRCCNNKAKMAYGYKWQYKSTSQN